AYLEAGGDPWPWHVDPLRRQVLQCVERGVSGEMLVEAARRVGAGAWGGVLYPYLAEAVRVVERERGGAAGDPRERTRAVRAPSKAPANGHALSADTDSESVATTAAMTVDRPVEEPR